MTALTSRWPGGMLTTVQVTNAGTAPVTDWTVGFRFPGDARVGSMWNATPTQSGRRVTAAAMPYDATIAPGERVTFGFVSSYDTDGAAPTDFTLGGAPCTGG